jgi:hypothetical protein
MPETLTEQSIDQSTDAAAETADAAPEESSQPLSIADHAKKFGPQAKQADEAVAPPATTLPDRAPHPSATQRRDKPTGQFAEGRTRHRARSQEATADDAPRIAQLTRQVRERDEEIARLRSTAPAPAGNGQPPAGQGSAASTQPRQQQQIPRAPADPTDPEPVPTDPRFNGDYGVFLREQAQWAARDQFRQITYLNQVQTQQRQQQQQERAQTDAFNARFESAMQRYPDLREVIFQPGPPPWTSGSLIDAFVRMDDNGIDLAYYLRTHPGELESISKMSETRQARALSLLLQRFDGSNGTAAAGTTGAAPLPSQIVLPPKPATPVRTEAQRVVGGPPPTDGSLSIAEHSRHFGQNLNRRR